MSTYDMPDSVLEIYENKKEVKMKYQNKDGIELSYTGTDSHQLLVKEVIREAIKILGMYDRNCKISMGFAMSHCKKILKESLDE